MDNHLALQNVIQRGSKMRVCHSVPFKLDHLVFGAEITPLSLELQKSNSASDQARLLLELTEVCCINSHLFGEGVKLLIHCLLQCPLKANLCGKIYACLAKLKSSQEKDRISRDILCEVKLLTATQLSACALSHLLALCVNTGTLHHFTEDVHGSLCEALIKNLKALHTAAFIETCTHVAAASHQQNMQHLLSPALNYFQQLQLSSSFQKDNLEHQLPLSLRLIETLCLILSNDTCTLDLRLAAGQLLNVLMDYGLGGPAEIISRYLDSAPGSANIFPDLSNLAELAVFHGSLCCMDPTELFTRKMKNNGQVLGIGMIHKILDYCHSPNNSELVLSSSRVINHWTLRLLALQPNVDLINSVLPVNGQLERHIMNCIWLTWEHYLDRVKHISYETFLNFLELRKVTLGSNSSKYFTDLVHSQCAFIPDKKSAVHAVRCLAKHISVSSLMAKKEKLVPKLISRLSDFSHAGCCSDALKALLMKHSEEVNSNVWKQFWVPILFESFKTDMLAFGFELLLKDLLQQNPSFSSYAISYLLERPGSLSSDQMMLLISCIKIKKDYAEKKRKKETANWEMITFSEIANSADVWKDLIPYGILRECLLHVDEKVQIAAFALLSESNKSSELYSPVDLLLMLDFFTHSLCIEVPAQRQIFAASAKKMLLRLRDSANMLNKSKKQASSRNAPASIARNIESYINSYSNFGKKLFERLIKALHCCSPYPERSTALSLLQLYQTILLGHSDTALFLQLPTFQSDTIYIHTLIESLGDNFETNKSLALQILQNNPCIINALSDIEATKFLYLLIEMASSFKPTDVLSASYIFRFLKNHPSLFSLENSSKEPPSLPLCKLVLHQLKKQVSIASTNLTLAAKMAPMYGLLLLMHCLLQQTTKAERNHVLWKDFLGELVESCLDARNAVKAVVENDSPEGIMPENQGKKALIDGHSDVAFDPDTQMYLLCAWRTVKEVSLLFGDLLHLFPIPPAKEPLLDEKLIDQLGSYFLSVMADTKHKGAFEQSYNGFVKMCEKLWQSDDINVGSLPKKWVRDVLNDIEEVNEARFCALRRSAGIPFIIQAILMTEPSVRGCQCLKETMHRLLSFASDTSYADSFTRLHAFNILRALYRDTKLGDNIVPFVSEGVKCAIRGFSSKWWSIRNSATLLYSALITRMLGVKKNKDDLHSKNTMSAIVFFSRYKELYTFLLETLEEGAKNISKGHLSPSTYPVLLLLVRLSPSPLEGVNSSISLGNFLPSVMTCTQSQIYSLRDLSSKALPPLISVDNFKTTVANLCDLLSSSSANVVHGSLLSLENVIRVFEEHLKSPSHHSLIVKIIATSTEVINSSCFVNKTVAMRIQLVLYELNPSVVDEALSAEEMKQLKSSIRNNVDSYDVLRFEPGFHDFILTSVSYLMMKGVSLFTLADLQNSNHSLHDLPEDVRSAAFWQISTTDSVSLATLVALLKGSISHEAFPLRCVIYKSVCKLLQENEGCFTSKDLASLKLLSEIMFDIAESDVSANSEEIEEILLLLMKICLCFGLTNGAVTEKFSRQLLWWSDAAEHNRVRLAAATASVAMLKALLGDEERFSTFADTCLPSYLHSICLLLQCDESDVRHTAASAWPVLLSLCSFGKEEESVSLCSFNKEEEIVSLCSFDKEEEIVSGLQTLRLEENQAEKTESDELLSTKFLIRDASRKSARKVLAKNNPVVLDVNHLPKSLRCSDVLRAMFHFTANLKIKGGNSVLLQLAMSEDDPDPSELSQDCGRAFDKSEVSILKNDLELSSLAAEVLFVNSDEDFTISRDVMRKIFSFPGSLTHPPVDNVKDFIELLMEEFCFTVQKLVDEKPEDQLLVNFQLVGKVSKCSDLLLAYFRRDSNGTRLNESKKVQNILSKLKKMNIYSYSIASVCDKVQEMLKFLE